MIGLIFVKIYEINFEDFCNQTMRSFVSPGLASLIILAGVHLFAGRIKVFSWLWQGRFLSFAAGISFAYVFVDLLPVLEKGQPILKQKIGHVIPYLSRHVYVIALIGVLFFYGLQSHSPAGVKKRFWFSMFGYLLFNFFVGASLADASDPDIQPLSLFTIAMSMHYFISDRNARIDDISIYKHQTRFWLVGALFLGYLLGYLVDIPDVFVAIAVSFLAGSVFLNVMHYELPKREHVGYLFFVLGSLIYTAVILGIGRA